MQQQLRRLYPCGKTKSRRKIFPKCHEREHMLGERVCECWYGKKYVNMSRRKKRKKTWWMSCRVVVSDSVKMKDFFHLSRIYICVVVWIVKKLALISSPARARKATTSISHFPKQLFKQETTSGMIMRENDISDLRKSILVRSYSHTGNSRKRKKILKNYLLVGINLWQKIMLCSWSNL